MRFPWLFLALGLILGSAASSAAAADRAPEFSYALHSGESLWDVALLFLDQPDAGRLAKMNDIKDSRRVYPGQLIRVPAEKPRAVVREYITALSEGRAADAWGMFCSSTRAKYTPADLENALDEMSFSPLSSLSVAGYRKSGDGPSILRIAARMEEDPAPWGFNLVWENSRWCILLLDLVQGPAPAAKSPEAPPPVP